MKNILVLGSEGFMGSNAVSYFSGKGYEVYKADIILQEADHYMAINPEQPDFASLFSNQQFDCCINATGAANVQFSFNQPALDYTLNVSNVFHILNAIRLYNPACKFINFSSAAVYGNPQSLPVSEQCGASPVSPYGMHKLYSEQICREFTEFFSLKTISLRIFSAYGEGLKKQLFWDLFRKIKSSPNNSIELFGTGNESRDFIYIWDIMHAIEIIIGAAQFEGEAINVASGKEVNIKDAVELFVSFIQPGTNVVFKGKNKKGDPLNWMANISLLASKGFSPSFSFEEGLKKTAHWMKAII
ncbi:MAG: NAD-dependent epimerase/dehydratase family protein [Bacteroidetes bacterium]|nr:NAD-dependent epimerase/dehydratase family protein [Bacteroidota bacterium]MBS1974888.1 NAD-dependent epimerase/dehydratase family protein [Bacteroidota bacterium]